MIKNIEDKKRKLQYALEDLKAFEGNEKKINKIEKQLEEIEIQEEFEDFKNNRKKIKERLQEYNVMRNFISKKGLEIEYNNYYCNIRTIKKFDAAVHETKIILNNEGASEQFNRLGFYDIKKWYIEEKIVQIDYVKAATKEKVSFYLDDSGVVENILVNINSNKISDTLRRAIKKAKEEINNGH